MAECTLFPGAKIYPRGDLLPCSGYSDWRKEVDLADESWSKQTPGVDGFSEVSDTPDSWTKVTG